jgi:DME family drug/metabolite transporter
METTLNAPAARHGLVLILIAALMWGTVGVATQALYNISNTNPLSIGFFRLAISVPALALACFLLLGRLALRITLRDFGIMGLIGAAMAFYQVAYFASIQLVGVSIAVLVTLCTAPVIVALLGTWLLHEQLTQAILLALVCAIGGTVLLVGSGPATNGGLSQTLLGVTWALGSALGYSLITLASRALAERYHPLQPITVGFAIGALLLLPMALATGLVVDYSLAGWGLLMHLGLIPTALAYVFFLAGMRHTRATNATIITLIEPLTATLLAWVFFGEQLGALGLLGGALLIGAILLLYRQGE